LIKTEHLTKKFGKFTAVNDVNLNIQKGEIYGFLGPNGSGKTTTIMMLLGLTRPSEGNIFLFDEKYDPSRLDLRARIGVVPEKHPRGMWKWMTAWEYLRYFGELFRVERLPGRIDYLLEKVDLARFRNKKIHTFSRGMFQKLSISRALLHDPDILLLDEPHSGLDPIGMTKIRDLIVSENREGRTIFVSSHLLSEVEKICHRVAIIYNANLLAEDTMDNLVAKITDDREITVELESVPEDTADSFRRLPFVRSVRIDGVTIVLNVEKSGDHRKSISELLIQRGLVPLRIQEKNVSLEDAFTTITRDNVKLLAGIGGAA
jgi:ABC-type multidrug transport system ATPase subunit